MTEPFRALVEPPYVAVIFTSRRTPGDDGYAATAAAMEALAAQQPGYLGIDSARDADTGFGITVSYWRSEADALAWKHEAEHRETRRLGRERWYSSFSVHVATVQRTYGRP